MAIKCRGLSEEEKAYILENFRYEDGRICRNDRRRSDGSIDRYGYLIIKIKGRQFKSHRIAWLLTHGEYPTDEIDHIDGNKLNNRVENLRISDRTQQNRNKRMNPNPDTGVVGIYIDKSTKGLKKKFTFKHGKKTYRAYTLEEARRMKNELQLNENTV